MEKLRPGAGLRRYCEPHFAPSATITTGLSSGDSSFAGLNQVLGAEAQKLLSSDKKYFVHLRRLRAFREVKLSAISSFLGAGLLKSRPVDTDSRRIDPGTQLSVAASILTAGWDDETLATLVRLLAYLAGNGLHPERGGELAIPISEWCRIAGTPARIRAHRILRQLPTSSGLPFSVEDDGTWSLLVCWAMPLRLAAGGRERR